MGSVYKRIEAIPFNKSFAVTSIVPRSMIRYIATTTQLLLHSYYYIGTTTQVLLHSYYYIATITQVLLHSYFYIGTTTQLLLHRYIATTTQVHRYYYIGTQLLLHRYYYNPRFNDQIQLLHRYIATQVYCYIGTYVLLHRQVLLLSLIQCIEQAGVAILEYSDKPHTTIEHMQLMIK